MFENPVDLLDASATDPWRRVVYILKKTYGESGLKKAARSFEKAFDNFAKELQQASEALAQTIDSVGSSDLMDLSRKIAEHVDTASLPVKASRSKGKNKNGRHTRWNSMPSKGFSPKKRR